MNTFSKCVLALRRSMTRSYEIVSSIGDLVDISCWKNKSLTWIQFSLNQILIFKTKVNQMSCKILVKCSPHWKGQYSFVIYISHTPYAFIETILVSMYPFLWSANFTAYHMFRGGGPTELKIKRNISWTFPVN